MDDRRLDELLNDAKRSYRAPPNADLDAIWSRVESEAFAAPQLNPVRRAPSWRVFAGAMAATLVLGVALGRVTAVNEQSASIATAARQSNARLASNIATDPYQRQTQEFLGRAALLLASLPSNGRPGLPDDRLNEQARQLLGTTRLLLDSPVGHEQRMKDLLEDLELVLAQVARLQTQHRGEALSLINEAMQARDVVPRIRTAAADLNISDY